MDPLLVSEAEAGQKLLNFLQRRVDAPQGDIQRWIRTGQVRRNKGRTKPFDRVEAGDEVRIPPFAALKGAGACPVFSPFPLAVFEDENLLVINKPAGLPVQGGSGHSDSLASRLAEYYRGADFVPAPAHRLDKDTSGLVAAGKTYAMQRRLSDLFARIGEEELTKNYLAWVWGRWSQKGCLLLEDSLVKDGGTHAVLAGARGEGSRQAASLAAPVAWKTYDREDATLMQIRLLTGRTHQIRVQLAERGFPVVGDPLYGDPVRDAGARRPVLKLHAARLVLPKGGEFHCLPRWAEPWTVKKLPDFSDCAVREQARRTPF